MKQIIFYLKNILFRYFAIQTYLKIKNNEKKDKNEILELNFRKRKEIVNFAYNNSLFYKQYYNANNFNPQDLKTEKDWDKVPVITREDLIKYRDQIIVSKNKKYLISKSTGGSTGVPLKIFHDKRFPSEVIGWRVLSWWKIHPFDNSGSVFRNTRESKFKTFINKLIWFPTRRILLDASSMSIEDMDIFIEKINKVKPKILQGYVGAIEELALYIINHNKIVHQIPVCLVTSSPITNIQRNNISKAFKCDVMDQYGSCEVYWLAQEAPDHIGLYVNYDCRHISVLNENNKVIPVGQIGNFSITDLENKAFPIIKYLNGDRGHYIETKNNSYPFPLIAPVKGRISDCIYLPDKSIIGGDFLTTLFDEYPDSIKGFKIYQKKDYHLIISYIPNNNSKELNVCINNLKIILKNKTRNLITIEFISVTKILHDRGKNRYIISDVIR